MASIDEIVSSVKLKAAVIREEGYVRNPIEAMLAMRPEQEITADNSTAVPAISKFSLVKVRSAIQRVIPNAL